MISFCFTRILSPLSPPFPFLCPFRSFPCILACPPCHPNVPMLPYVASYIFLCSLLSHLCASPVFPPPYSTKILPLQSLLGKWKRLVKSAFVYHEFSLSIRTSFLCPYFPHVLLMPSPIFPSHVLLCPLCASLYPHVTLISPHVSSHVTHVHPMFPHVPMLLSYVHSFVPPCSPMSPYVSPMFYCLS